MSIYVNKTIISISVYSWIIDDIGSCRSGEVAMIFEEWMKENCSPPDNYSFAQYGRYLEGWRNSMPWAYKDMSLAYDAWAESHWEKVDNTAKLKQAWRDGQSLRNYALHHPMDKYWMKRSTSESADFMLSFPNTIKELIGIAIQTILEQETLESK